jgi:hypothetical protein
VLKLTYSSPTAFILHAIRGLDIEFWSNGNHWREILILRLTEITKAKNWKQRKKIAILLLAIGAMAGFPRAPSKETKAAARGSVRPGS